MKDTCENPTENGTVTNNGLWKEEGKVKFMVFFLLFNYKDQMMYISLKSKRGKFPICVVVEIYLRSPFSGQFLAVSRQRQRRSGENNDVRKIYANKSWVMRGRWVLFTLFGFDFSSSTEKHSGENFSLSVSSGQKSSKRACEVSNDSSSKVMRELAFLVA